MGCKTSSSSSAGESSEAESDEPVPKGKFANLKATVTPTRTKFETGKQIVAEIPHSEGPPLDGVRGLTGTIVGSQNSMKGRLYEVSFDLKRQTKLGTAVLVKERTGKIIYGPDEDQEFIVQFEETGEFSDCLKLEDFTFPGYDEAADATRTAKIPEEYLRSAGAVATSSNVQFLSLDQVFRACRVHTIPVFQRRYCWTERQCTRLWQSVCTMKDADPEVNNHSLGRLMLLQQPSSSSGSPSSRLVLDGQQRLTTLTLLLKALQDRLELLGDAGGAVLCSTGRLVPTLDDQSDFERCLADPAPEGSSALLAAKRCFASLAEALDSKDCRAMVKASRQRLSLVAFVLEDERSMQRVYENLAKRVVSLDEARRMGVDLSTCHECHAEEKQTPSTHWGPDGHRLCGSCASAVGLDRCEEMSPGVEMSPVDLIRNYVMEHFKDEATMRSMHAEYWSPLEHRCGGTAEGVEQRLQGFLEARGFHIKHRWYLYSAFTAWWRSHKADAFTEACATANLAQLLEA